jgi:hypothetical protein
MIAIVSTSGKIYLWNTDQKDLAIRWARSFVGRGSHVALVDAATLDPTAVAMAQQRQTLARRAVEELDL